MSLLSGMLGNASEVNIPEISKEFEPILVEGEHIEKAFKVIRDMYVFTNKRLILVDKQGITGSKVEFKSLPYKNITAISKQSAGILDLDAELKLWVKGVGQITAEFKKGADINGVYKMLSEHIL